MHFLIKLNFLYRKDYFNDYEGEIIEEESEELLTETKDESEEFEKQQSQIQSIATKKKVNYNNNKTPQKPKNSINNSLSPNEKTSSFQKKNDNTLNNKKNKISKLLKNSSPKNVILEKKKNSEEKNEISIKNLTSTIDEKDFSYDSNEYYKKYNSQKGYKKKLKKRYLFYSF